MGYGRMSDDELDSSFDFESPTMEEVLEENQTADELHLQEPVETGTLRIHEDGWGQLLGMLNRYDQIVDCGRIEIEANDSVVVFDGRGDGIEVTEK